MFILFRLIFFQIFIKVKLELKLNKIKSNEHSNKKQNTLVEVRKGIMTCFSTNNEMSVNPKEWIINEGLIADFVAGDSPYNILFD